ncbi:MAG: type IV pilus modification PilV family protein [Planctomycetota bacterium]|jgi:hypothetical protein
MKHLRENNRKQAKAFTLVECLVSFVILMIAFLGIMRFRYYTVVSAEQAENELLAARSALLISEAWRATKAELTFDPVALDFVGDFEVEEISLSGDGDHSGSGTLLGNYRITVDDKEFIARLFYRNAGVQNLRQINVIVSWADHLGRRHQYQLPTLSQTAI